MSSSAPLPKPPKDEIIYPGERLFGNHISMIVCPTTNNRIKLSYHLMLRRCFILTDDVCDFLFEKFDVCFGGFNQQLALIFTNILSKKIKSLLNIYNPC